MKTQKKDLIMKTGASYSPVLILSFVLALAAFSVLPSVVSAQHSELANVVGTQDLFNATASVPEARFVHTATAANIVLNSTYIDHPLTNENPNATVLVTQNWNPGGTSGEYNDHSIGVWYDSGEKKWAIFNQDLAAMPEGADFNVLIPATGADAFVHAATAANTSGHVTYIDHPLTNEDPNAIVLVTQNWNPGGSAGTYNDHAIGVWYDSEEKKWAIFNQDFASMPDGADFNVLIPPTGADVFVHAATAANIVGHYTYIDHPLTNENPNAIVLVTQNWNPGGSGGTYNDHSIGVWYDNGERKWAIFNQDFAAMPEDAAFNVLVPVTNSATFVHAATAANIDSNWTYIDHPLTNGNSNAIVLVTQNWNPGGSGGTYNDHPIGVWYDSTEGKWAIFNQDLASIPTGADFNALIPAVDTSVFVHIARAGSISGNWTYIDHPLTNEDPNAIVLVTPNWNPSGSAGTYNNRPIGVWYDSVEGKWAIFNQDLTSMPDGAAFNVLIPLADTNVFVHTATAANIGSNWTYIDHSLTNENPNAIVLVTQNWNPGGSGGTYNDHPIGVWYDSGEKKWAIFNQDLAGMPEDAAFNVVVIVHRIFIPLVLRGT